MKNKVLTILDGETKQLRCLGCKGTFTLLLPLEVGIVLDQMKAFEKLHKYCQQ